MLGFRQSATVGVAGPTLCTGITYLTIPPRKKRALEAFFLTHGTTPHPPWQAVSGTATVLVAPGKKIDHLGIKAELIGQIGK